MTSSYVLITGATSDIGTDIALKLSRTYNLVISGKDEKKLKELVNKLDQRNIHIFWKADLSNPEQIFVELSGFLVQNNITISSLVNAAGYFSINPQRRTMLQQVQVSLNVNLISAAALVKALVKRSNKKALEKVVFISSISAFRGYKGLGIYSAAKNGLLSLAKALAKELAPKVKVNSIVLGAIKTSTTEFVYNDEHAQNQYPLGEGELKDVSSAVEFLISEKSNWMTGQELVVDGGVTII